MTHKRLPCPSCGGTCPTAACRDPRVAVRRVLICHLSHSPLVGAAFPDRIAALLTDLDPHITTTPQPAPDQPTPSALTDRELAALAVLADGGTHADIAAALDATTSAVRSLMGRLLPKLHATNGAHAVAIALRTGLLR